MLRSTSTLPYASPSLPCVARESSDIITVKFCIFPYETHLSSAWYVILLWTTTWKCHIRMHHIPLCI
jgi:hypothetical protein